MNKHSIRTRLLVTMLSLIIVLLTILTYVQISSQQSILERELKHHELSLKKKMLQLGEVLSDNLANQVAIEITAFNFSKVTELVNLAVQKDSYLEYGILMNSERTAHLHTQKPELEYETLSAPEDIFAAQQQNNSRQSLQQDNVEIIEFILPISISKNVWFLRLGFSMATVATEISISRQEKNEQIHMMIVRSIITTMLFLSLSTILIVMIAAKISKPLVELTNVAKELTNGNFAVKIPVCYKCGNNSKDEIAVLATTFTNMAKNLETSYQKLEKYNKSYERFVPHEFLNFLNKESIVDINLGDQVEKEMTILFSDIRDFTSISEKLTPEDNFDFINTYLGYMEPVILQYQGIIDKYIGDAIMVLFPTNADDALKGAIAMLKVLAKYNNTLRYTEFGKINIGIGLHTGKLMLGIIGGQSRMDGTVISDAVNSASRVESLTKFYGISLLITEYTFKKLTDPSQYSIRVTDITKVKGKTSKIMVYEVFDTDSPENIALKNETLKDFESGFALYHDDKIADAKPLFESVLQVNPNDTVAQVYLERCQKILSTTMPEQPLILIVDDMPTNIQILLKVLSKHNFKIFIAKDGETALKMASIKNPHLILLDIMMPGMNGFEVCKQLKKNLNTKNIPVIFTTALSEQKDKVKGFKLGAVDYITKPFEEKEVLSRIKIHLKLYFLQQQIQMKNVELKIQNEQLKGTINATGI
ncbi:response regulator [Thiotrichales bacterium HSG1]|nr:response regulator [Thiotrichales bacterium HSG1]